MNKSVKWTLQELAQLAFKIKSDKTNHPLSSLILKYQKELPLNRQRSKGSIYVACGSEIERNRVIARFDKALIAWNELNSSVKTFKAPEVKAPEVKAPEVKAPEVSTLHTVLASALSQLINEFTPKKIEPVPTTFNLNDIRLIIREELKTALSGLRINVNETLPVTVAAKAERTNLHRVDIVGFKQNTNKQEILSNPIAENFKLRFMSSEEAQHTSTFSPTVIVMTKWLGHAVQQKIKNRGYTMLMCNGSTTAAVQTLAMYLKDNPIKTFDEE